jgi:hypothetical protein
MNDVLIPLEQYQQKQQDKDDAEFIADLLSNEKRKPNIYICRRSVLPYTRFCNCFLITIAFYTLLTSLFCIEISPGIGPFKIPEMLLKFRQDEEKEYISFSKYSFLELESNANQNDTVVLRNIKQENTEDEMLQNEENCKAQNYFCYHLIPVLVTINQAKKNIRKRNSGFLITEVDSDEGNSDSESGSSDYRIARSKKDTEYDPHQIQSNAISGFSIAHVDFSVADIGESEKAPEMIPTIEVHSALLR